MPDLVEENVFNYLLSRIEEIISGTSTPKKKLLRICRLLHENVTYYDWVGFYLVDRNRENQLVLGPYVGAPTEHIRITFGQGICGQAAQNEETFVIQDVSKETNYLSCSIDVKSEIVVPIFKNGKVVGELDIDSHELTPFTNTDKEFLERVAEKTWTLM